MTQSPTLHGAPMVPPAGALYCSLWDGRRTSIAPSAVNRNCKRLLSAALVRSARRSKRLEAGGPGLRRLRKLPAQLLGSAIYPNPRSRTVANVRCTSCALVRCWAAAPPPLSPCAPGALVCRIAVCMSKTKHAVFCACRRRLKRQQRPWAAACPSGTYLPAGGLAGGGAY